MHHQVNILYQKIYTTSLTRLSDPRAPQVHPTPSVVQGSSLISRSSLLRSPYLNLGASSHLDCCFLGLFYKKRRPMNLDCPIKEQCKNQREALPGEPCCVICGRYGEYICDETDDDICSKECKQILLSKVANDMKPTFKVEEQAKQLAKGLPFKTALVVGGDAMAGQVHRIQKGIELIVGTPGRLIDLFSKHNIELDEVRILVLDEVDCMLQRGFRDQVMQIFKALAHPQLLMVSATLSHEVDKLASLMTKELIYVLAGTPSMPSTCVKQVIIWVESKHKKGKLFEILTSKHHFKPPVVVFVSSRLGADLLSEAITVTTGLKSLSIHGEKGIGERREVLRLFLTGEVSIIVSTGILGRGIDLLKVQQVIIFDMPNSMKEYVHQVGRASSVGKEGTAIVFINDDDKKLFEGLVQNLKSVGAAIPRELANSQYTVGGYPLVGRQKRTKYYS